MFYNTFLNNLYRTKVEGGLSNEYLINRAKNKQHFL